MHESIVEQEYEATIDSVLNIFNKSNSINTIKEELDKLDKTKLNTIALKVINRLFDVYNSNNLNGFKKLIKKIRNSDYYDDIMTYYSIIKMQKQILDTVEDDQAFNEAYSYYEEYIFNNIGVNDEAYRFLVNVKKDINENKYQNIRNNTQKTFDSVCNKLVKDVDSKYKDAFKDLVIQMADSSELDVLWDAIDILNNKLN